MLNEFMPSPYLSEQALLERLESILLKGGMFGILEARVACLEEKLAQIELEQKEI